MLLKSLSELGVPFTLPVTIDHSVTNLFVLPEGSFYTVETLILDPVTGVPLKPLVDYMYFQQVTDISLTTAKQTAAIIQIRNPSITSVVVKGFYSHGVTQDQINDWESMCILYKDVPKWMNWLACLDDVLQVHPNVKRTVIDPPLEKRTLSDVEVELNYVASQFEGGDSLYLSHIEYWQQQLFLIAEQKFSQATTDLTTYLNTMQSNIGAKDGDFLFTTGNGVRWGGSNKNEYFGITLKDRGTDAIGTYTYLPSGSAIPATRTRLFNRTSTPQSILGTISTNKLDYLLSDVVSITVRITQLINRVSPNTKVQVVDLDTQQVIQEFPINNFSVGTYNFQLNLSTINVSLFKKKLVVRIPEYLWLTPSIITVTPTTETTKGYIKVEMIGETNTGVINGGGFINTIKVKFKRVGILSNAETLYVHLSGDYPNGTLKPGYPSLQTFNFPTNFNESIVTVAEFLQQGETTNYYKAEVKVSKTQDPSDAVSIVKQNIWYISTVPVNPYIAWHFAIKEGNQYTRVSSVDEGTTLYAIGNLSVDALFYGVMPQLTMVSSGIGSAVDGVDFVIDRGNLINIDNETVAYKITLPLKPEQETNYKFLNIKTINSNTGEVWIVDKIGVAPIAASWHNSALLTSPVTDWVSETSTFYLRVKAPNIADGTKLNISLVSPEMYRSHLTFPSQITVFGGVAIVEIKLNAPRTANVNQYIKMLIVGPNINYTTLGILVLDTSKPFYELRYVVNGVVESLTANPGDLIQCQARCIKGAGGSATAAVMLSGNSITSGLNSDFDLPVGSTNLLKSSSIASTEWTDLFIGNVTLKNPIRLDYLSLTTNVIFPTTPDGVKQGADTNLTLNLRKV